MYEILKNQMLQREREQEASSLVEENAPQPQPQADTQLTIRMINKVPGILIAYTIPVVGIVFGVWYHHECPAQIKIPILEIAFFSLSLLEVTLKLPSTFRAAAVGQANANQSTLLGLSSIVQLFAFGVFISLSYYVYSTDPLTDREDYGKQNYCDYLFYNVTFWGTTAFLTLMCLSIPVWIITACCIAAYKNTA